MPTFFSTVVTALYERVRRSSSGHGRDPGTLESLLRSPGVLEAAVTHSIHDFVCTAVHGIMDEETRTASLMGHLASNVNWYALVAHWSAVLCPNPDADRIKPCNIFWAQQSRHVESWRGADFGIAVRTGEDTLRIALYQAKRCDPEGNASLLRKVDDLAIADRCLRNDAWNPNGIAGVNRAAVSEGLKLTALHQVHRLEIWRRRGIELLKARSGHDVYDYAWCRYAFWHDIGVEPGAPGAKAPTERSGRDLYHAVRSGLLDGYGAAAFRTNFTGADLGMSLCFHNDEDLEMSSREAAEFLGRMKELNIPDFITIDETEGGAANLPFWKSVFSASHPAVTHIAGSTMAAAMPRPDVAAFPKAPDPAPGVI